MTAPHYEELLTKVPVEHRALVEDIVRGLKSALRKEREAVRQLRRRCRGLMSDGEAALVAFGGGMPSKADEQLGEGDAPS